MKNTSRRAWPSATGHGPGVRRHWASLTPAEQDREHSPYAMYVSLAEYLRPRHGH